MPLEAPVIRATRPLRSVIFGSSLELYVQCNYIRRPGKEIVRENRSGAHREFAGYPHSETAARTMRLFGPDRGRGQRSEEHTSELQSLMRTSYAVFCLKKTINIISTNTRQTRKSNKIHITNTST